MATKITIQDETAGCLIPLNNTFGNKTLADDANDAGKGFRSGLLLQLGAFGTAPGLTFTEVVVTRQNGTTEKVPALDVLWINIFHSSAQNAMNVPQLLELLRTPIHGDLQVSGVLTYWTEAHPAHNNKTWRLSARRRDGSHRGLSTFELTTGADVAVDLYKWDLSRMQFASGTVSDILISTNDDTNHGSHIDPPR